MWCELIVLVLVVVVSVVQVSGCMLVFGQGCNFMLWGGFDWDVFNICFNVVVVSVFDVDGWWVLLLIVFSQQIDLQVVGCELLE